nr:Protein hit [uncultured bacterium]
MTCIFCEIAAGRAPASLVYEDERALVILDLFPVREGHALVMPKVHEQYVERLDDELAAHLLMLARRLVRAQQAAGIRADANNLVINNGKAANQHIPHVHLHVIPRLRGDTLSRAFVWSTRLLNVFGMQRRRARLDALAARIAAVF